MVEAAGAGLTCSGQAPDPADEIRQAFDKVSSGAAYRSAAYRIREQILSMPPSQAVLGQLEIYVAAR